MTSAHDPDAILERDARRLLRLESIEVLVEEVELEHRRVERVANLVGEVESQRPHRTEGLGVGRQLLARAEELAAELGYDEVRLYTHETMTENIAYYPRRGYTETHRGGQDGSRERVDLRAA